jgi:hypothetical protein
MCVLTLLLMCLQLSLFILLLSLPLSLFNLLLTLLMMVPLQLRQLDYIT